MKTSERSQRKTTTKESINIYKGLYVVYVRTYKCVTKGPGISSLSPGSVEMLLQTVVPKEKVKGQTCYIQITGKIVLT